MRTYTPSEFIRCWPGSLRPVAVPAPGPNLPDDCRRWLTESGLPPELTIYCYNDISLRFTGSAAPLSAVWQRDLERGYKPTADVRRPGEMPAEWNRFWHLADQEYLQGGGWICVEEATGRLVVIDLDQDDPIYLLNASVGSFYTTLAHFLAWTEATGGSPAATLQLRAALGRQDAVPPEELEPFWLNLIDATLDGDPRHLRVVLGPKRMGRT